MKYQEDFRQIVEVDAELLSIELEEISGKISRAVDEVVGRSTHLDRDLRAAVNEVLAITGDLGDRGMAARATSKCIEYTLQENRFNARYQALRKELVALLDSVPDGWEDPKTEIEDALISEALVGGGQLEATVARWATFFRGWDEITRMAQLRGRELDRDGMESVEAWRVIVYRCWGSALNELHAFRRAEKLSARRAAQPVSAPSAGRRCSACGKKPAKFDDLCGRCAEAAGVRPHGKVT